MDIVEYDDTGNLNVSYVTTGRPGEQRVDVTVSFMFPI